MYKTVKQNHFVKQLVSNEEIKDLEAGIGRIYHDKPESFIQNMYPTTQGKTPK
jgi:hypothetical protein